ncbi:MAG: cobalamin biosynthesis protein CobD, partial [Archaeoglobales archaeon]
KAYRYSIKLNGHAIVAMAHTLAVTLEKPGYYTVNAGRLPGKEDIEGAISIYWKLSFISVVIAAMILGLRAWFLN